MRSFPSYCLARLYRLRAATAPSRCAGRRLDPGVEQARETERTRIATTIDAELRAACRADSAARRELGEAARALLARRGYARLGFARLADYAQERLGVSARTLQTAAWLATRLDALPLVGAAFDRSELTWAQARAICRVARAGDQLAWLARARACSAEQLEALVRRERPSGADDSDDDGEIDGEPAARLRLTCPARIRALWRHALAVASRAAGEPLAVWRGAEIVAAEAFAGRPSGASFGDRALLTAMRLARRARRLAVLVTSATVGARAAASKGSSEGNAALANEATSSIDTLLPPSPTPQETDGPSRFDAFALDARLVHAIGALRTTEPRIGRLLRIFLDQRFYRAFGHRALDAYVRERLGISTRKAWALLTIERRARPIGALADHYDQGRLSWVRALTLLPVVHRDNAEAWLARAEAVTVRRLVDEVNWVLEARDALGAQVPLDPPPPDSELTSPVASMVAPECRETSLAARLQIGTLGTCEPSCAVCGSRTGPIGHECRKTSLCGVPPGGRPAEICDAEIAFTAPATVMALFRDAMDVFAVSDEPRWTALERILRHVIAFWESAPPHRDPVFARDGWRCTVPACSSRRNLHDHHVQYRSRGGDNGRGNRTTICAAHHLHGIHGGTIRASGTAPRALHWELGVRNDAPPLLRYVGDTRVARPVADGEGRIAVLQA